MKDGLKSIQKILTMQNFLEFFVYFVDRQIEIDETTIEMWSFYKSRHRTTNTVEGRHKKINTFVGNSQQGVAVLEKYLKKEAKHTKTEV